MYIPKPPQIPLEMDERARETLYSIGNHRFFPKAARVEDNLLGEKVLYVLGNHLPSSFSGGNAVTVANLDTGCVNTVSFKSPGVLHGLAGICSLGLAYLIPSFRRRNSIEKEHKRLAEQYKEANLQDMIRAIAHIDVRQGSIADAERDLGPLERVSTREPETFITGKDNFWLRVKAYLLGADAIVEYQPGSSIGTPVRKVQKE